MPSWKMPTSFCYEKNPELVQKRITEANYRFQKGLQCSFGAASRWTHASLKQYTSKVSQNSFILVGAAAFTGPVVPCFYNMDMDTDSEPEALDLLLSQTRRRFQSHTFQRQTRMQYQLWKRVLPIQIQKTTLT